jgi:hypothetical protein
MMHTIYTLAEECLFDDNRSHGLSAPSPTLRRAIEVIANGVSRIVSLNRDILHALTIDEVQSFIDETLEADSILAAIAMLYLVAITRNDPMGRRVFDNAVDSCGTVWRPIKKKYRDAFNSF